MNIDTIVKQLNQDFPQFYWDTMSGEKRIRGYKHITKGCVSIFITVAYVGRRYEQLTNTILSAIKSIGGK